MSAETIVVAGRCQGMTIKQPMSNETFRSLAATVLAARGAYVYLPPNLTAALSRLGWRTLGGEITAAGEAAFHQAQKERAARRNSAQHRRVDVARLDARNPERRCPLG